MLASLLKAKENSRIFNDLYYINLIRYCKNIVSVEKEIEKINKLLLIHSISYFSLSFFKHIAQLYRN